MIRAAGRAVAAGRWAGATRPQAAAGGAEIRALVPVAPVEGSSPSTGNMRRPCAAFLAHLIATREQCPQTRERRRADPAVAAASYGAAMAPCRPMAHHALSRAL